MRKIPPYKLIFSSGEEYDKDFRTAELELNLTDLKPGTWYSVTVTAHLNNPSIFRLNKKIGPFNVWLKIYEISSDVPLSTYPSLPATFNLMTKPLPPSATVDLTQVLQI